MSQMGQMSQRLAEGVDETPKKDTMEVDYSEDSHNTTAMNCEDPPKVVRASPAAIAKSNKSRIRTFFAQYHFSEIFEAECKLYASVLYFVSSEKGVIEAIVKKRPTQRQLPRSTVFSFRVVLLGPKEMFLDPFSSRHFFFDMQQRKTNQAWPSSAESVIKLTQSLLNSQAVWMREGFDQGCFLSAVDPKSVPQNSGEAGKFDKSAAERVAMANLKYLGHANVPQCSATLYLDMSGRIQGLLYGRPDMDDLDFMNDPDNHLTVVRVFMTDVNVVVQNPFEKLNACQSLVVKSMQAILQDACRSRIPVPI